MTSSSAAGTKPVTSGRLPKKIIAGSHGLDLSAPRSRSRAAFHRRWTVRTCTPSSFYLTVPFVPSWSLLDALACARVVLASDVEAVREVVAPGVNGLVEHPLDVEGLTATALAVLADPAAYRPLGQAGRALVQERSSQEVAIPELEGYFEPMAAG
jgi:glycosyltransferase involved in cell wall biosynthesis